MSGTSGAAVLLRAHVDGSPSERSIAGPAEVVVIGRGSAASWRLDGPLLSRRHLQLEWKDGVLRAEDMGSRNGSYVNGEPLCASTRLVHGDRLMLGPVEIDVAIPGSAEELTVARSAPREGTQPTRIAPRAAPPPASTPDSPGRRVPPRWHVGLAAALALGGALLWAAQRRSPTDAPGVARQRVPGPPGRHSSTPTIPQPRAPAPPASRALALPTPTLRRDAIRLFAMGRREEARRLFERIRQAGDADPAVDVAIRALAR